jgi:hypothetical protein
LLLLPLPSLLLLLLPLLLSSFCSRRHPAGLSGRPTAVHPP